MNKNQVAFGAIAQRQNPILNLPVAARNLLPTDYEQHNLFDQNGSSHFDEEAASNNGVPEDLTLGDIYELIKGTTLSDKNIPEQKINQTTRNKQHVRWSSENQVHEPVQGANGVSSEMLRYSMQTVHQQKTIDFVENNIDDLMNSIEDLQNENVYLKRTVDMQERHKTSALRRIEELEWCIQQQQANVQREVKQRLEAQKRAAKIETEARRQQQGVILDIEMKKAMNDMQQKIMQLEKDFKKQQGMIQGESKTLLACEKKITELEHEVKQQQLVLEEEKSKTLELQKKIEEMKQQQQQQQQQGQGLEAATTANRTPVKWSKLDIKVGTESYSQSLQKQQSLGYEDNNVSQKAKADVKKVEKVTSKYTSKTQVLFDDINEESNENLVKIVIEESKKLNVDIKESDIMFAKRLGEKTRSRARSIVVRLTTEAKASELVDERNRVSAERRASGESYAGMPLIRPCLTDEGIALFHRAQDYVDLNRLHAVFSKDGCIFAVQSPGSTACVIKSERHLLELLRK